MNERLSLQDLIDLLAKNQEITKKDAESFLRELIAVISENIENNEPVKIKDFGVFKLVMVNARRSVDVNTGEAIEIAAHYKLSFTPDKLLKDAINRPFAHFESVILEEGVSFENVEKEDASEEETEDVAVDEIETSEELSEESTLSSIVLQDIVTEDKISDVAELETVPSVAEIMGQNKTEDKTIEERQDESVQDIVSVEESTPLSAKEETLDDKEEIEPVSLLSSVDKSDIESDNEKDSKKKKGLVSLGFFISLIIVGFLIGGLYFQEIAKFLTSSPTDENIAIAVVEDEKSDILDSLANKGVDSLSILADTIPDAIETLSKSKNISETNNNSTTTSNALATITIEPGNTLRNISLKYYGHKSFWVYIYEENKDKIENANNIPLGTKLIIPLPVKYGINPHDKPSVDTARQREQKLFSAMSL